MFGPILERSPQTPAARGVHQLFFMPLNPAPAFAMEIAETEVTEICVGCDSAAARYACCCRMVSYCGRRCQRRHWTQHRNLCQRSIVVHSLGGEEHVITCPTIGRVRDLRKRTEAQLGKSRCTGHQLQFSLHGQLLEDAQLLATLDTRNGESVTYAVRSVSERSMPSLVGSSD